MAVQNSGAAQDDGGQVKTRKEYPRFLPGWTAGGSKEVKKARNEGVLFSAVGRSLFDPTSFRPYDPTQEPIFPPELKLRHAELGGKSEFFCSERMRWFR